MLFVCFCLLWKKMVWKYLWNVCLQYGKMLRNSTGCFLGSWRTIHSIALQSVYLTSPFWGTRRYVFSYPPILVPTHSRLCQGLGNRQMDHGLFFIKLSWGNKGKLRQAYLIDNLKMELQADGTWLSKLNWSMQGRVIMLKHVPPRTRSRPALCIQWHKRLCFTESYRGMPSNFHFFPTLPSRCSICPLYKL